ncbi:hypothetical protein [Rhodoplanes serenus]|uniref:hypothetical protein n=1 Tax=Rhodoplanes serenus TaxID=200615 RepID=UPI000DAD7080|nr:hypothetical protein [Rhodoplanes serenus]RAI34516.1 hypothetical protein CH340_08800 [Rhodoplanes serenus]
MSGLGAFGVAAFGDVADVEVALWMAGGLVAQPAVIGGALSREVDEVEPGACLLRRNLADEATVTASSWIPSAPPTMLQDAHTTRRWQGEGGISDYIVASWPTAETIDTVVVLRCAKMVDGEELPMTSAATTRVRLSSADQTGAAGDAYDTMATVGAVREEYSALVVLLETPVSAVAVRVDLSEPDADAVMAGRLIVGRRAKPAYNFAFGWAYGYADQSRKRKSAAGLTFVDREDRVRTLNLSFDWMTESDRWGIAHDIDRVCGTSRDILVITDQASTELDRDTVWGLLDDQSPPVQPFNGVWKKSYQLTERL